MVVHLYLENIMNKQINCSSFDLCSVLYKDAYQVVFEERVAGKGWTV